MTDIQLLNEELSEARRKFEAQLRLVIEQGSVVLAEAEGITDPDTITASASFRLAEDAHLSPVEYVAKQISRVVRRGQESVSLAAARGLDTKRAQEWYARHVDRLNVMADRAGKSGAAIIEQMVKAQQITKIGRDGRKAFSLARSIESVGAGGPATVSPTGAVSGAKPVTLMDDEAFQTMIREEGSATPQYTWEHGAPDMPFGPHEALDGTSWTASDELVVLANPYSFPPQMSYFPGDHDGCTCRYEVNFVRLT